MIGIAVIGAGRIGQIHAANLARNPRARLLYISDSIEAAAKDLAQRCNARVASLDRLLDDRAVDAVLIASSTDTHANLVERAAKAKKAIFCEKPLDLDAAAAQRCVDIAQQHAVRLCVGFNRRHDPSFDKLHSEIRAGQIGDVEVISITSRDPSPPPADYIARSGGLFRDMMIHDLDMGRWLLGEEPDQVYATGSALASDDIRVAGDVDTAIAVLRTPSGRLCQITNSRRCTYGYDQRIEVFGSGGLLRVANATQTRLERADANGFATEPALPFFLERYADAYRIQLDRFLRALGGDALDIPSGNDGVRALQLADAAQKSLQTAAPVAV
ncbi:MAG TPA: inositol 2-dehydrogenase [Woeseiaceae bacterium]|nr:inositol 2-dehydrogenase [Woeseiaceae bacterium]